MASATVELIITAKDSASGPITKTAAAVDNLGKSAEHTHGLLSGAFTGIGFAAFNAGLSAVSSGFHALGGFIGDSIQESRDAAHGLAQTEAVIKSTGGAAKVTAAQIVDMAGALSHSTLFTDDAIQADENLLLTFTNLKNGVGEGNDIFNQATKVSLDLAQAMGTDAAGGAVQLGKALNDPTKGISALTRVGVTFTDQQKNMIKSLQDSGDLMGAQKIILAELNKEFGGSAEAAAKADGGFHLFNQRMADVKQTIGDALQPALASLMGFLAGPGLDAVEAFGGGVARWLSSTAVPALIGLMSTLGDLGRYIGAVVDDGDTLNDWLSHLPGWLQPIAKVGGEVITVMQGLGGAISDAIAGLASGDFSNLKIDLSGMFGDIDTSGITTALQGIREGWGLARDALVTFQQAWAGDWKNADSILPLHQAIGDFGVTARGVFDWLSQTGIPQVTDAFTAAMPGNIQLIHDLTTALTGLQGQSSTTSASVQADLNALTDPFSGVALWINTIQQSFNWLGQQTHEILVLAGSDLGVFWGQIQSIGTSIGGVLTAIGGGFAAFGTEVGAIARLAASDFGVFWTQVQSIGGSIGGVLSAIGGSFTAFGANVAATARVAASDFGVFLGQIQSIGGSIGGVLTTMGANFASFGANVSATVKLAGADVATVFANIVAAASSMASTISGVATAAWSIFSNAVQAANASAVNAMNGIGAAASTMATAIGAGINTAVGFISSLPGRAAAAVGDLSGILVAAGSSLIGGLISGIQSRFAAVQSTLAGLTKMLPSWKGPADVDARLLYDNGRIIIGGFIQGLSDSFPQVRATLGTLTGAISDQFTAGIQAGAATMTATATSAVRGVLDGTRAALSGATFTNPLNFLIPDPKTLDQIGAAYSGHGVDIGMRITEGMQIGMLRTMPALWAAMQASTDSGIQELVGFIQQGDNGPLTAAGAALVTQLQAGIQQAGGTQRVVAGMQFGILNTMPDLLATMRQSTDSLIQEIVGFIDNGDTTSTLNAAGAAAITALATGLTTQAAPAFREMPAWTGYSRDLGNGLRLLGDQIPAVQDLGNGLTLLGDQWARQADGITDLAPRLPSLTSNLGDLSQAATTAGTAVRSLGALASYSGAKDPLSYLAPSMREIPTWTGYVKDLGDGLRLLGDQTPAVQDLGNGLTLLGDQWARQATAAADLGPHLPQLAAGYTGIADAAKSAAAATVRATDDILDHVKLLGGASLDAMGGFNGGGGDGGALAYLNGPGGLGGSADYAKQAGSDAGMGFGDGWKQSIEQIGPVFQDTTRMALLQLHDVVLLPWQTQTNDFFSGAGFGFIGQASIGINSAGNGLAQSAGNVGGAAGASLVSSMRSNLGGVDAFVNAVNASLSHIEREVTIHVKTVYDG